MHLPYAIVAMVRIQQALNFLRLPKLDALHVILPNTTLFILFYFFSSTLLLKFLGILPSMAVVFERVLRLFGSVDASLYACC